MMKHILPAALLLCATLAQAHEGHGLSGVAHWHADTALPLLAAAVAAALWLAIRRK
jgi:hypothetical protein